MVFLTYRNNILLKYVSKPENFMDRYGDLCGVLIDSGMIAIKCTKDERHNTNFRYMLTFCLGKIIGSVIMFSIFFVIGFVLAMESIFELGFYNCIIFVNNY